MYRFSADRRGRPRIDWNRRRNSGIVKPGQAADAGSGTTPTLMHGDSVAITDNADPLNVVVYRKRLGLLKCRAPVYDRGARTAIDARTGATASKRYAGNGLTFNSNYAGVALGPDGTAYLGVIAGAIRAEAREPRGCRMVVELPR